MTEQFHQSPLQPCHERLGAQFTDFGGWQMPLRFTSDRVEHTAVREDVGLFDLSHMAQIEVEGPHAGQALDTCVCTQPSRMKQGRARYSMILAEDGGILDDLIIYHLRADHFLVVANAANRLRVRDELSARIHVGYPEVAVVDETASRAMIALQGPRSRDILTSLVADSDAFTAMPYYSVIESAIAGVPVRIARTGYTGELGYELMMPAQGAQALWDLFIDQGLQPCGLACRDTLRLEAGMPLYGHELTADLSPKDVGSARLIKDHTFVGSAALASRPATKALYGLVGEGKRAARAGCTVAKDGQPCGVITSGVLSPTLGYPIAMALLEPGIEEGAKLDVEIRGKHMEMTVTSLPFYTQGTARN